MAESNVKEKVKGRYKKIFKIGIYIFLLLFLLFILVNLKVVYINFKTREIHKEKLESISSVEIKNNQKKIRDLELKFGVMESALSNKIENLENNILTLQNNINNLQKDIIELENNNPVVSEKNLQIVILLYKIETVIYNGGDFTNCFEHLKNLVKNKNIILESALKLEKYKIQNNQAELKKVFFNDYIKILKNKEKNNKIVDFLNENIKIRKTANFDGNINSVDLDIANIENEIDNRNYIEAINIILKKNYQDFFINTLNILNEKNEALKIVEEILDFIYKM